MRARCRPVWVLAAAVVLVLAGCGTSADPETWAEAEEDDRFADAEYDAKSAVEHNFMVSCIEANTANLTEAEARVLCGCSFTGLREQLTLQQFQSLDKALRETPQPQRSRRRPRGPVGRHRGSYLRVMRPQGRRLRPSNPSLRTG